LELMKPVRPWYATILLVLLLAATACHGSSEEKQILAQARQAFSDGQYFQAEESYEVYLSNWPQAKERWEAWQRLLHISLHVRGDNVTAAELLEAMLLEFGADPDKAADVMIQLGEVYGWGLRQWDKAVQAWERCLDVRDLEPQTRYTVYHLLAQAYQEQGLYDQARDVLEQAVDVALTDQDKARSMYKLGLVHALQGDTKNAKYWLEQTLTIASLDKETRAVAAFSLADIYMQEEQLEKARDLLASILDTHPNPRAVEIKLEFLAQQEKTAAQE